MARLILKSKSSLETEKISSFLAKEIVKSPVCAGGSISKAFVLALEGNLGSGKTTFTQGFARSLGIKENVLSPTFVLMKVYKIGQRAKVKRQKLKHLVHIDCYRIESPKDLLHLGFKSLLKDKDAIILIEWADRVRDLIPRSALRIKFKHGEKPHERIIQISKS